LIPGRIIDKKGPTKAGMQPCRPPEPSLLGLLTIKGQERKMI